MPTHESNEGRPNVTTILRHLRPKLPPGFKKTKDHGHVYSDGSMVIELSYFCSWEERTSKRKRPQRECFPTSIQVRPADQKHRKTFPVRTFPPRADKAFNYDGIAAAATKAREKIGAAKEREEWLAGLKKVEGRRQSEMQRKIVKTTGLSAKAFGFRGQTLPSGIDVEVKCRAEHGDDEKIHEEVDVKFEHLTVAQATRLVREAEKIKKGAQSA